MTEGFERLSKLFDNSIAKDNSAVICNTDSVLRYGTDGNGNGMVVIDPIEVEWTAIGILWCKRWIVYRWQRSDKIRWNCNTRRDRSIELCWSVRIK